MKSPDKKITECRSCGRKLQCIIHLFSDGGEEEERCH